MYFPCSQNGSDPRGGKGGKGGGKGGKRSKRKNIWGSKDAEEEREKEIPFNGIKDPLVEKRMISEEVSVFTIAF